MAKYQRTRQAKWDRRQLRTLTTKVRQADRDATTAERGAAS